MKVIIGLGNPGREYQNTRHNAGWIVLDEFIKKYSYSTQKSDFNAEIFITNIKQEKVLFVKPNTFMNLSGSSVIKIMNFYKLTPEDILIIHDEKDFPIGQAKFKLTGSSGGHNGINSIINTIGTTNFKRLRIGVGTPPPPWKIVDWVLSKMNDEEIKELQNIGDQFSNCLIDWISTNDFKKVLNKYN